MPREFSRAVRVAEGIKRVMAKMVSDWTREIAAGMASVTQADVSPDLKRAKIYVSLYGCEDPSAALDELNLLAGRFRHALGRELRLRNIPVLEFLLDESLERGDKISRMLNGIQRGEPLE
jgi:ribosome-binding factor A